MLEAYDEGDSIAKKIVTENAYHIAELAVTVGKRLSATSRNPVKIVFVGGLTKRWDVFGPIIKARISEVLTQGSLDISIYNGDVVEGALLLAGAPKPNTDNSNIE